MKNFFVKFQIKIYNLKFKFHFYLNLFTSDLWMTKIQLKETHEMDNSKIPISLEFY